MIYNINAIRRFFAEVLTYGMGAKDMANKFAIAQTIFRKGDNGEYAKTNQHMGHRFCRLDEEEFLSMVRELDALADRGSTDGLVMYVGALPIDAVAAGTAFLSETSAGMLQAAMSQPQNVGNMMAKLPTTYFSYLEKCPIKKKLIHWDVDVESYGASQDDAAGKLYNALSDSGAYFRIILTRGGFHIFAAPSVMQYASAQTGKQNREEALSYFLQSVIDDCECSEIKPCGSIMCPLPGTQQKDSRYIIKFF
jgi:hypothetical protein